MKDKFNQKFLLNWSFNAWAKYKNFNYDNNICNQIKNLLNLNSIKPKIKNRSIILEGGSIDVNGKGLMLTTKECLLGKIQERNPGLKKKEYEDIFKKFLGIIIT